MNKVILLFLLLNVSLGFAQNAPIDFEPDGFGASWTWATFEAPDGEENPTFSVVANPSVDATNASATVAKMEINYATNAGWGSAGCESMHNADLGVFSFTPSNSRVKMMIYQEGFAAPVALKFATNSGYALGEVVTANTVADAWVEVEFNMSAWIGNPNGAPDQIIFFPSYAARATGHTVYFDNVNFGGAPPAAADPMVSAPNPTIDESEVLSVYSNFYTTNMVSGFNFNAFQGAGVISEIDIESDGNITGKIEDLSYYGAQWDAVDLNGYEYLHIDYWATTSTAFNVYLIDQTAGIPGGSIEEARYSIAASGGDETIVKGEWRSVFIPLQHFVDYPSGNFTYDLNDIFQWKFDGNGTVFFDNIYFTSATNVSTTDIQLGSIGAYPNPTNSSWRVKTPNINMTLIEVFDMAGKNVLSIYPNKVSEAEIDGRSLNTGLYFAKITTPNGVFSAKLIKK